MKNSIFDSVFFDLDGTLADTAPDLAEAANKMLIDRNLPPLPMEIMRPLASSGARGMIRSAFGIAEDDPQYNSLKEEFLSNYEQAIHVHTCLFPHMEDLLNTLDTHAIPWGIVTNKHQRFTIPLVKSLGLDQRTDVIVSGDTTPFAKPHPAPLIHALQQKNATPNRAVYIGDDLRDIVAGKAAGMQTIAAAYGYCGDSLKPEEWQADYIVHDPKDFASILFSK
jgi:N-acetyl-D-muramate 6-phosphate phosphatase